MRGEEQSARFAAADVAPQSPAARSSNTPPDLLNRDFTAEAPNHQWVTGVTYCRTWVGVRHVAFVIGCFSRAIVGWHAAAVKDTGEGNHGAGAAGGPAPGRSTPGERAGYAIAAPVGTGILAPADVTAPGGCGSTGSSNRHRGRDESPTPRRPDAAGSAASTDGAARIRQRRPGHRVRPLSNRCSDSTVYAANAGEAAAATTVRVVTSRRTRSGPGAFVRRCRVATAALDRG